MFVGHAVVVAHAVRLAGHDLVACVLPGVSPWRQVARDARDALRPQRRPAVVRLARSIGVPVVRVRGEADWARVLRAQADLLICAGFPVRIPDSVLSRLPLGGWNVHPSLLPAHRGPRPVERALLAGDASTGVSVHRMTPELDAGPILWAEETPILPGDSCDLLTQRLLGLAAAALPGILAAIRDTPERARPQPTGALEPRPRSAELQPDLTRAAQDVARRIQAANGGHFRDARGRRVRALAARIVDHTAPADAPAPGCVLAQSGPHVLVQTGEGALWLTLATTPRHPVECLRAVDP